MLEFGLNRMLEQQTFPPPVDSLRGSLLVFKFFRILVYRGNWKRDWEASHCLCSLLRILGRSRNDPIPWNKKYIE